jgi:hypothetical protein
MRASSLGETGRKAAFETLGRSYQSPPNHPCPAKSTRTEGEVGRAGNEKTDRRLLRRAHASRALRGDECLPHRCSCLSVRTGLQSRIVVRRHHPISTRRLGLKVSRTFGGVETLAEVARGTYLDADGVNLGPKPLSGASDPRSSPLVCLRGVCVTG